VHPLTVAREIAAELGLDARDAVVLRETRSTVVDLAPAPVLARVWPAGHRDLDVVRRELAVTSYLAHVGAPVAAPWTQAGPHERAGAVVTLWWRVDHDPDRPLDGAAAGRALGEVHGHLADHDGAGLPHFARLDEVRAVATSLDLTVADATDLAEALALAEVAVAGLDVRLQPVHGDAWLGNVLRAPGGPVWSDFERLCLGPCELDLTCNETAARSRGRGPEDDAFLAGYGDHDAALRERLAPLELLPLAAWTYQLAASQPAYLDLARTRLAWALDGLRG
jgi:aminoglycoside phosphotransferase (APT) family kinase protein